VLTQVEIGKRKNSCGDITDLIVHLQRKKHALLYRIF
jgi:hypothetical protein